MIRKIGARRWRVISKHGHKNLGTFPSLKQAKKRVREVEFFKRKYAHQIAV